MPFFDIGLSFDVNVSSPGAVAPFSSVDLSFGNNILFFNVDILSLSANALFSDPVTLFFDASALSLGPDGLSLGIFLSICVLLLASSFLLLTLSIPFCFL